MKANFYNKTLSLIIVMLAITSCKLTAQPGMSYSTNNKKAIKFYEASRACYGEVALQLAEETFPAPKIMQKRL